MVKREKKIQLKQIKANFNDNFDGNLDCDSLNYNLDCDSLS